MTGGCKSQLLYPCIDQHLHQKKCLGHLKIKETQGHEILHPWTFRTKFLAKFSQILGVFLHQTQLTDLLSAEASRYNGKIWKIHKSSNVFLISTTDLTPQLLTFRSLPICSVSSSSRVCMYWIKMSAMSTNKDWWNSYIFCSFFQSPK